MTRLRPIRDRPRGIAAPPHEPKDVDSGIESVAVRAHIEALPPLDVLGPIWRALEARAEPSFFLSWHWIGAWLAEGGVRPALLVALRNDVIVGLALIGQDCPCFGPLRWPRIHLNQAGAIDLDSVHIEYNDILVDNTDAKATRAACLAALYNYSVVSKPKWREFRWAGSEVPADHMPSHRNLFLERFKVLPSPYVDLDLVRANGSDLLILLSRNMRYQIRRAIRLYEEMGELRIERATTTEEGLAWLEELRRLHQSRWTSRGKLGVFARPFFACFLLRLVDQGLHERVVDILRVSAGRHELGYLYNFVYRDRVSNYQSGFRFGPNGHYKPGLVAHTLAVRHYASEDSRLRKYSFLAGATQYKESLSTGSEELCWYAYRHASRLIWLKKAMAVITTRLGS